MATFLDVSGLQHFSNIFAFLFVWLVVYAILQYSNALKTNNVVNILIGLIIGILTLFSPTVSGAIISIAPWFALIFVFVLLLTVVGNMFGASDLGGSDVFKGLFLTLVVIFFIVGLFVYVRDRMDVPDEIDEDSDYSKVSTVLFHPKMIALIFIMVLAIFTVGFLAKPG